MTVGTSWLLFTRYVTLSTSRGMSTLAFHSLFPADTNGVAPRRQRLNSPITDAACTDEPRITSSTMRSVSNHRTFSDSAWALLAESCVSVANALRAKLLDDVAAGTTLSPNTRAASSTLERSPVPRPMRNIKTAVITTVVINPPTGASKPRRTHRDGRIGAEKRRGFGVFSTCSMIRERAASLLATGSRSVSRTQFGSELFEWSDAVSNMEMA